MNRGIYTVASGMIASQQAMDTVANNLANVNTAGFKQDRLAFNDALERSMNNSDGTPMGTLGSGAQIKARYVDFHQGAVNSTGNPLDLAIEGQGMFAVQGPDGQVRYTRDGSFTTTEKGELVTQQGYPVLDSSLKPIQVRSGPVSISADGAISNQDGTSYAQLGIFNGTFNKFAGGLYQSADATARTASTPGITKLKQGAVEGSNVSSIGAMTQMIELGRSFEMSQKAIQSQDELTQKLTSTLNTI